MITPPEWVITILPKDVSLTSKPLLPMTLPGPFSPFFYDYARLNDGIITYYNIILNYHPKF